MIDESRLTHLDPETRAALAKAVERIVAVADPAKIILFGSAARGALSVGGDLDLLVVMDREVRRLRVAGDIHVALYDARVPLPVDVVVVTDVDVERHRNSIGTIVGPALREGLTCYERVH